MARQRKFTFLLNQVKLQCQIYFWSQGTFDLIWFDQFDLHRTIHRYYASPIFGFSSRRGLFSVSTVQTVRGGVEAKRLKTYLLRHNLFSLVNCCGWAIEKWSLCLIFGGSALCDCLYALCQDPPLRTGPFPSSRLLPAGSVTIGIIKNWLPQTVPWLTCIIEPESFGNLPRVKEAERNTLWWWASFSETSHTHKHTHLYSSANHTHKHRCMQMCAFSDLFLLIFSSELLCVSDVYSALL